jgi:endonuclease-3 related protein
MISPENRIRAAHAALLAEFGPQHWWPGDGPFEVMVGAVLTQGTSWKNVVAALSRLREAGLLGERELASADPDAVLELIRPAGFQRRKQQTLTALAVMATEWEGGLAGLLSETTSALRERLLSLRGIGPETADAIALYAAERPVFVVDAYTRRFAERHGLARRRQTYEELSRLFSRALRGHRADMSEFHALLVRLGKTYCRPTPRCHECPLNGDLGEPRDES